MRVPRGQAGGSALITSGYVLPTPSSNYRGTFFVLLGATQAPDILYICLKDYQDNYRWSEVTILN